MNILNDETFCNFVDMIDGAISEKKSLIVEVESGHTETRNCFVPFTFDYDENVIEIVSEGTYELEIHICDDFSISKDAVDDCYCIKNGEDRYYLGI